MATAEIQKQHAIDVHSEQAAIFETRYETMREGAYQDCFAYSRHRLNQFIERYLPARGDGLRLLDVGCGTGHHLAEWRTRGFTVAGVDGSAEMLARARELNPAAEIRQADVEALPFASASFDVVISLEVLRYLPSSTACIREIARVLKPGGMCLVTAAPRWNLNGYWLINRLASLVSLGDLTRLKQFFTTSRRLRREFAAAGFDVPHIHGVYGGPVNWVERLMPSALPTVLKVWEPVDAKLSDRAMLREFANMFLVSAVRGQRKQH